MRRALEGIRGEYRRHRTKANLGSPEGSDAEVRGKLERATAREIGEPVLARGE
jgi:hypothetical protein